MLGQPMAMLIPEVVGFEMTGRLPDGATATDLVLTVTEMLRKKGVVDKFVEFYGPGLSQMTLPDRATISNMAPEYGATIGFFPVDDETLRYMRFTGRSDDHVELVERYCKENLLWRDDGAQLRFSDTLELDLATVEPLNPPPARRGRKDRVPLAAMSTALVAQGGRRAARRQGRRRRDRDRRVGRRERRHPARQARRRRRRKKSTAMRSGAIPEATFALGHGAVVIAAITSCTNTSNPSVLMAAGLLAKAAVLRSGLKTAGRGSRRRSQPGSACRSSPTI